MELYHLWVTVLLGLMTAAISKAGQCRVTSEEDNGCVFYYVTSLRESCYIHIRDQERDFAIRKWKNLTEAILDFIELQTTSTSRKPETKKETTERKLENKRKDITEIIEENWTRVQANSSSGGEPTAYVIGTEEFHVPSNFSKFKTYIWVKGSLHYTNDTNCFLGTTTTQSPDTQYMTTTQSTTGSQNLNTTQSTTSDYTQSTTTTESVTTAGTSEQWWLYVIIGVLIMIIALLAVTAAFQKRRKTDADDAMTLRHKNENSSLSNDVSWGPQIPDFYGNTDGEFQTENNPTEHIYEEPDFHVVTHNYYEESKDNGGPVTCGTENSVGHPPSPERGPTTRRGSAHDSENSLYGCIPAGDFQP